MFFRTLLFKFFNRIGTWEEIERAIGPVVWERFDLTAIARVLETMIERETPVYSPAYIMPAPRLGCRRKYENHLALLARMIRERLPERIEHALA